MFPIGDHQESGRFPLFTIALILLNIWIFFIELTTPDLNTIIAKYALIPAAVNFRDLHSLTPFITSQFLHGGWFHIITNMLFLWVFGRNVEARMGLLFVPFYLAAGIVGGLAQYFVDPASAAPTIGASGAIAGVLGAYLFFFPGNLIRTIIPIIIFIPIIVDIPAAIMIIYWFLLQLFSGLTAITQVNAPSGGVAYFAHLGGFGFGWLISHWWGKPRYDEDA